MPPPSRSGRPYSLTKYRSDAMRREIERSIALHRPDIIVSSLFTYQFIPRGNWIRLLDVHNLEGDLWAEFEKAGSALRRAFVRREARLLKRYERQAYRESDGIIAISSEDAEQISRGTETPTRHVPVAIEPAHVPVRPDAYDIGMLGVWSWGPNAEALDFFERYVVPGLLTRGSRICIFGPGMSSRTRDRLSGQGIWCAGFVPDVRTFYENVRVVAAPFFFGGGVRMKVAEALSHGRPVIGTPLAFRGIGPGIPRDWIVSNAEEMVERLSCFAAPPEPAPAELLRGHGRTARSAALKGLLKAAGVELGF